jgi:hypothetical protein
VAVTKGESIEKVGEGVGGEPGFLAIYGIAIINEAGSQVTYSFERSTIEEFIQL